MARLFVAVWLPEDVLETLRALPRKDQRDVRFLPPENWHVTLRFLGDASVDDVAGALDAGELPEATARVGPAVDLLGRHSVVAPVHGLDELAAAIGRATRELGDVPPRPEFRGHITLARVKRGAPVRKVVGLRCDAEFDVGEVALVESILRPAGAQYTTVATWPTR